MATLNLQANFHEPSVRQRYAYTPGDRFYDLLIQGHQGLADAESEQLNARLVLLLANHIGELGVLADAIQIARSSLTDSANQETTR